MSTQITLTNFMKGRVKASTVLDHIEKKLIEQGCQSKNAHGNCTYRGENGTKCGIGHIIPDSSYVTAMDDPDGEDNSVAGIIEKFNKRLNLDGVTIENEKLSMLADIQNLHDGANSYNGGKSEFIRKIKNGFTLLREEYSNV
jgi:hypothetical protein